MSTTQKARKKNREAEAADALRKVLHPDTWLSRVEKKARATMKYGNVSERTWAMHTLQTASRIRDQFNDPEADQHELLNDVFVLGHQFTIMQFTTSIDLQSEHRRYWYGYTLTELSEQQTKLIDALGHNSKVSVQAVAEAVWGDPFTPRGTIDKAITGLRRKLEEHTPPVRVGIVRNGEWFQTTSYQAR